MMDHYSKNKKNTKGFYIALGVCLIAVGVAAWTTYDSVSNFISPANESSQSSTAPVSSSGDKAVDKTISGVHASSSSAASSPASSAAPKKPESQASSKAEEPASSKQAQPTDAPVVQTPDSLAYPGGKTIIKNFSEDPIYSETMKDWRAHTGMDFSGAEGDEVKAAAAGAVKQIYTDDFYGATVVISHGELETLYAGLDQILVKEGDEVKAEQKIGTLGMIPSESADGTHLHFSVRRGEKWIAPATLLK